MQRTVPVGLDRKEAEIYQHLDTARLPKHIAIIMDGNGRWAKRRHLPRIAGHRAGVPRYVPRSRPPPASAFPRLRFTHFRGELEEASQERSRFPDGTSLPLSESRSATLNKNNIRLEYIGRQHELPASVQEKMQWAREATSHNTGMALTLALNYSARTELVDAFRSLVDAAARNGGLEHLKIDEDAVSRHLYTRDLPDPDLVVRTSGEMRLSNFFCGNWRMRKSM